METEPPSCEILLSILPYSSGDPQAYCYDFQNGFPNLLLILIVFDGYCREVLSIHNSLLIHLYEATTGTHPMLLSSVIGCLDWSRPTQITTVVMIFLSSFPFL